jgi:hypothetical protein
MVGNSGMTTAQRLCAGICTTLTSKNISTSLRMMPHLMHGFNVNKLATQEWSRMMSIWANVRGCFAVGGATF